MTEQLWTTKEAAQYLKLSEVYIRELFRKKGFPRTVAFSRPGGKRILFNPERLRLWAEGRLDAEAS